MDTDEPKNRTDAPRIYGSDHRTIRGGKSWALTWGWMRGHPVAVPQPRPKIRGSWTLAELQSAKDAASPPSFGPVPDWWPERAEIRRVGDAEFIVLPKGED